MTRSHSRSSSPSPRNGTARSHSREPELSRSPPRKPYPKSPPAGSPRVSQSRSRSVSPRSRTRSRSREHRGSLSQSRSRSHSHERGSRGRRGGPRRVDGKGGIRGEVRSRSRSRERGGRRQARLRSRSRERQGRSGRRTPLPRPNVEGYKPPERWLRNLFEDGLKETLETSQLPVNVSKINDCMKRLDPTYHITESDFPNFSLLCYWFDDMEGLLCVEKEGDSVTLVSSPLEAEVTRRDMPRRLPRSGPPRPRLRRQRRRERSPLRPRRGDRRGGRRTGIRLTKSPSADRYVERGRWGGDRGAGGDVSERWQMA